MEEVWEDISLSSFCDHSTTIITTITITAATDTPFCDTNLQDPPRRHASNESSANGDASFHRSLATMLSLNSGPNFHCLETSTDSTRENPPQILHSSDSSTTSPHFLFSMNSPFNALAAASSEFPSFCKKRAPEKDYNYSDRHHKRMMKNRESAVRSRARKQAYTNELELQVAHLRKENARLRREQEKFCFEAPTQLPKGRTLSRTVTAPF